MCRRYSTRTRACPEPSRRGSQFISEAFTGLLRSQGIAISMDGKGSWKDNVSMEQLWKSVKYEEVYLRAYDSVPDARARAGPLLRALQRSAAPLQPCRDDPGGVLSDVSDCQSPRQLRPKLHDSTYQPGSRCLNDRSHFSLMSYSHTKAAGRAGDSKPLPNSLPRGEGKWTITIVR